MEVFDVALGGGAASWVEEEEERGVVEASGAGAPALVERGQLAPVRGGGRFGVVDQRIEGADDVEDDGELLELESDHDEDQAGAVGGDPRPAALPGLALPARPSRVR